MIRYLQSSLTLSLRICVFLFLLWAMAALYVDAGSGFSLALLLLCIASGFYFRAVKRISAFVFLACFAVLVWWIMQPPSNDRDWLVDVSRLPEASIDGSRVTVSNVRNFRYQSENSFTENWETREYDLDKLVGFDLFMVTWGLENIAHTIASWRFSDGTQLAVSIETRKEKHETYSAFKGFFRQFEVYYVVADERDVIKVRTDHRGEKVRLYNLKLPLENTRALLLEYLREVNELKARPRWYNALTHNCTTAIRYHNKQIGAAGSLDWRLFLNDNLDELGYERGIIDQSLPLEELRKVSDITSKAKSIPADEDFSAAIREGLPGYAQ
jgi:hypothetical protein